MWNASVCAMMAVAADDAPNKAPDDLVVKQFEQQYGRQLLQLYRSELHFMRVVCQPTKQQYERLLAESPTEKATVRKLALMMSDRQEGRAMAGARSFEVQDLRKLITDQLAKSLRPTLSTEQTALYLKELDQRAKARKRVALMNLLAKLDKALVLTPQQRAKLGEMLENNWNDSWGQMQWLMLGGQHFPPLPDDKILPVLNPTQKAVWRGTPKGNIHSAFDFGFLQGIEIDAEVWPDELPMKSSERSDGNAAGKGGPRD